MARPFSPVRFGQLHIQRFIIRSVGCGLADADGGLDARIYGMSGALEWLRIPGAEAVNEAEFAAFTRVLPRNPPAALASAAIHGESGRFASPEVCKVEPLGRRSKRVGVRIRATG